jgi:hypothetical protein
MPLPEEPLLPALRFPLKRKEQKMSDSAKDKRPAGSRQDDRGQGIMRDKRGQDQPSDKERAQRTSGLKSQKEAAETQPQSPGQPAHGE